MAHDIIVIGAGMVGTCIAWHLTDRKANVLLVDRKAPGMETSYGNAGLIQREAVFPHPYPRDFSETLSVLPNQRPDIRYHLSGIWHNAPALLSYRYHSEPTRWRAIAHDWAQLIATCLSEHERLIQAANADSLVHKRGWLQMHRQTESYEHALSEAERAASQYGVEYSALTTDDLKIKEPHVDSSQFIGAIHWKNSWQVPDPGGLVQSYAQSFVAKGGEFKEAQVTQISPSSSGWEVTLGTEKLQAEHLVIATGPWSMQLLDDLGYRYPLFPKRGYHWHYQPLVDDTLTHSVFDADSGFLLGPMKKGIRLTTGAEMTTLDGPPKTSQIRLCERIARDFLSFGEAIEPQPWFGSRPCLPDMKPIIGPAPRHSGLWLAFGHAHQGFTLGPTTGRMLAEMMFQDTPFINPEPFAAHRFK